MNNCGVKIDEDGDEVCHCCQPPHYKIVSTEPWCVCDDNGNHHGYTGLNGVFVCCPAPPEGRPQPIRVGYECGQGCTGCCPNGTIYNIGSDDAGYPIEGCCEEPNKALPFSCCASGQEPVQNIDIYGNRIMRQMDACCPEGYATQAINGQCCSGEVYQNANSGNYECCPEGSTVSNGICCEAGKTGVPNYNSSGTQIGSFCCPAGTDNTSYVGAINGSCCGCTNCNSDGSCSSGYEKVTNYISGNLTCGYTCCRSETIENSYCESVGPDYPCMERANKDIYSSIGAINGVCCGGLTYWYAYTEFVSTYEKQITETIYRIENGNEGLKCLTNTTSNYTTDSSSVYETKSYKYDGSREEKSCFSGSGFGEDYCYIFSCPAVGNCKESYEYGEWK